MLATIPVTIGNVPFRGVEPAGAYISTYPPSQNLPSVPTTPYSPNCKFISSSQSSR